MEKHEAKLKKPINLYAMRPSEGSRLSPVVRKIYNLLLHRSQEELKRIGYDSKTELHVKFSTPLSDLIGIVRTTHNAHTDNSLVSVIKQTLRGLATTSVESTSPDTQPQESESPKNTSKPLWNLFTLVQEPSFEYREDNVLCLSWYLPLQVMAALSDLGAKNPYATINIEHVAKLSRYTSIALFEICNRFRNVQSELTAEKPPEWWVDVLTAKPSAAGVSRPWRKLKEESVLPSIEEIKSETDLIITLIEKKTGKKVTGVQFKIEKKPSTLGVSFIDKSHLAVISQGAKLGIIEKYIKELLTSHSTAEVEMALSKLQGRMGSEGKSDIENKGAYLRQILKDQPTSVITTTPAPIPVPPTVVALDPDNIYTRMNKEFNSLPEVEKQRFARMVAEDKKISLTPKIRQKLNDGISSVAIQSYLTAKYATEKYGPSWNKDTSLNATQGEAK